MTYEAYRVFPITRISIHTTRVGGDGVYDDTYDLGWISIHTTRVGGDKSNSYNVMGDNIFQSTPPCGWWHILFYIFCTFHRISIHTTRVGGDFSTSISTTSLPLYFNPHHPCGWWRIISNRCLVIIIDFNPHHPCGWWQMTETDFDRFKNFNPHHPCGWWLNTVDMDNLTIDFNPHHPCGWWLILIIWAIYAIKISIHTTRVGGDLI